MTDESEDRLRELRRGLILDNGNDLSVKIEMCRRCVVGIRSRSDRDTQLDSIVTLQSLFRLDQSLIAVSDLPGDFFEVLTEAFFDDLVDLNVRVAALSLFDLLCSSGNQYIEAFAEQVLYSKLFRLCSQPKCPFQLDKWLAVIEHFLRSSHTAFAYFSTSGLLSYLADLMATSKRGIERTRVLQTMSVYAMSPYFWKVRPDDRTYGLLMDLTWKILTPDFLTKDSALVVAAVRILESLMSRSPDEMAMAIVLDRRISVILMTLISPDNIDLSLSCASYLVAVTHHNDVVCGQLSASQVYAVLGHAMQSAVILENCAWQLMITMYNCLVVENERNVCSVAKEISQSDELRAVIAKLREQGSAVVKQLVMDFVHVIIYYLPDHDILNTAKELCAFQSIPETMQSGIARSIETALGAAAKIIRACKINPQYRDEVLKEMICDDIDDLLEPVLGQCHETIMECAEVYLRWVKKNISDCD